MAKSDLTASRLASLYRAHKRQDAASLWAYARQVPSLAARLANEMPTKHQALHDVNAAVLAVLGHSLKSAYDAAHRTGDMTRRDSAALGLKDEKTFAAPPKQGLAIVKSRQNLPVWLMPAPDSEGNQAAYAIHPWGAFLPVTAIDFARHTGILVVENWASFQEIDRARVNLTVVDDAPLIVYRGDDQVRNRAHKTLCQTARERGFEGPIATYMDIDPYGVYLAAQVPGLTHVLLPDDIDPARSSEESYLQQMTSPQLRHWRPPAGPCEAPWQRITVERLAIAQENF